MIIVNPFTNGSYCIRMLFFGYNKSVIVDRYCVLSQRIADNITYTLLIHLSILNKNEIAMP